MTDSRSVLSRLDPSIPAPEVERVTAWVADLAEPVSSPRPSASVLLLRSSDPAGGGLEVFVQHRHHTMAFAPGRVTFPGGRQESDDASLRACAVRELAEETGVQLAVDDLHHWSHWITPECEPLRYDTHFFLAVLPDDQTAHNTTTEAVRSHWVAPTTGLAEADAGRWSLMPPTRALLLELAEAGSVAEVLAQAADRRVGPVLGVPRHDPVRGWVWDYPVVPPLEDGK